MHQLTDADSAAMQAFCENRPDVCFVEWTGSEYRVYRVLFDGSESEGTGDTLEAAYLAASAMPMVALPAFDAFDRMAFDTFALLREGGVL